jgi:hypothetical protein
MSSKHDGSGLTWGSVRKMVRLFRQATSLRILINALSSSVVPVTMSFLILLLLASVYAVIASDLFGAYDDANFGYFSRSCLSGPRRAAWAAKRSPQAAALTRPPMPGA